MNEKYLRGHKDSALLFVSLFVLHVVVFMTKTMFSAAMASIVECGVMTKSQTGAISAGFWAVYAVSQSIGGFAADKYSPSKLIVIGLVSGIISNAIIYVNQSYGVVMAVWCINAAFQFGLWPGVFKIVSTQIAPEFRATAIFWVLLSASAGQAASMLVASIVPAWQQNFLISAIALAGSLVAWIFVYGRLEKKMVQEKTDSVCPAPRRVVPKEGMGRLSRLSALPILLTVALLLSAMSNGIKLVTPVMLMESYPNLPAAVATRMSILLIAFAAVGTFLANIIRTKVTTNELKATAILLLGALPVLGLAYFVGKLHYALILVFLAVAITFLEGAKPFINSYSAARFTTYGRNGTVAGLLNSVASVGCVFASYVFPKMAETMPWNVIAAIWFGTSMAAILLSLCMTKIWTMFITRESTLE